jgi:tRNA (mo5U34)-methyltransferase
MGVSYESIRAGAGAFNDKLREIKKTKKVEFEWYRYNSMAHFDNIPALLKSLNKDIFLNVKSIADFGGADGDMSLYLASLGYRVDMYDYGPTNMNQLQAAHCMKHHLNSAANIYEVDLDSQFSLKGDYDLTFFLGILYHLKNPYYALEHLSQHTRYMVLSTRVARFFRTGREEMTDIPSAYLLAPDESNNDATNYWIFTQSGYERLVMRTGWDILSKFTIEVPDSNPQDDHLDERSYFLLESKYFIEK